jgi:GT2 family glycosyltransferase
MPTDPAPGETPVAARIDVVVVNWNTGDQLRQCLESVLRYGGPALGRVVVVDNGSTDGSERSAETLDGIELVRAGHNLGFARGCNLGAARGRSEFVLLLNPDTRLFEDSLAASLAFMQNPRNAQVGIVGIQNVGEGGAIHRSCARFPTPRSFLSHSFGLSAVWPRVFPDHFMREWAHDTDRLVDHVIGSYYFVRRALWTQLGGLDERFFVYLEDLDFSLRARKAGWSTAFLARACLFHKGGGASERVKAARLFYALRSRLLYAHKHFGRAAFAAVAAATLFVEPVVRLLNALARGQWRSLGETARGYAALYRDLPATLRGRRAAT